MLSLLLSLLVLLPCLTALGPVCGSLEDYSPFYAACACKTGYYRNSTTSLCTPKLSLQLVPGYALNLITFHLEDSVDWGNSFTLSFWAKQLYAGDSTFFQRGDQVVFSRISADGSLKAKIKYTCGTGEYSTPVSAFPVGTWTHVILVQNGDDAKVKIYLNLIKVLDVTATGTTLDTSTFVTNASLGRNVGLMTEFYIFSFSSLQENYLPLLVYQ